MEAIGVIWSFTLLFSLFAFAELMGILLFIRVKHSHHFLAHLLGTLLPVLLYIVLSWMVFVYRYYRLHPHESCGGPLLGALGIIAFGTFILSIVSPCVQMLLHTEVRGCVARKRSASIKRAQPQI